MGDLDEFITQLEEVSKDLKEIYQLPTEEMTLIALDRFEEKY